MHMMYGYLHVCIPPWLVIKYSITLNEWAAFLQKALLKHSCSKLSEHESDNGSRKFDKTLGMHTLKYLKIKNARYIL